MFKRPILALLVVLCSFSSLAQTYDLSQELREVVSRFGLVGMGAARITNQRLMEAGVFGRKKIDEPAMLQPSDPFHMGSCGKSMTAFVASILVEEGRLSWSTPLKDLLPGMNLHPAYRNIPFELLFTHRAGFPANFHQQMMQAMTQMRPEQGRFAGLEEVLRFPPHKQPGQYEYSNVAYTLAGFIMENITRTPWEQLVREKVFAPLNLTTCGFGPAAMRGPGLPWGHVLVNNFWQPDPTDLPAAMGPAGLIHCSIGDWLQYLDLYLLFAKGDARLISPQSYQRLLTPFPANDNKLYTFGGWNMIPQQGYPGVMFQHTGHNGRSYAEVVLAPQIGTALITVQNNQGTQNATNASLEMISRMLQRAGR